MSKTKLAVIVLVIGVQIWIGSLALASLKASFSADRSADTILEQLKNE